MSVTYHAAAIVGCKIDKSEIFFLRKVRLCEHPLPDENLQLLYPKESTKFCQDCGKKLWKKEEKPIPQYDPDEEILCGLRVFSNKYDDFVIVAIRFVTTDDNYPKMLASRAVDDTMRSSLKIALQPHRLWDDRAFGIWVIMWY